MKKNATRPVIRIGQTGGPAVPAANVGPLEAKKATKARRKMSHFFDLAGDCCSTVRVFEPNGQAQPPPGRVQSWSSAGTPSAPAVGYSVVLGDAETSRILYERAGGSGAIGRSRRKGCGWNL